MNGHAKRHLRLELTDYLLELRSQLGHRRRQVGVLLVKIMHLVFQLRVVVPQCRYLSLQQRKASRHVIYQQRSAFVKRGSTLYAGHRRQRVVWSAGVEASLHGVGNVQDESTVCMACTPERCSGRCLLKETRRTKSSTIFGLGVLFVPVNSDTFRS